MERNNWEHHFIEKILTLLGILQKKQVDIGRMGEAEIRAALAGSEAGAETESAYDILRFMDEMPGGFLIYAADEAEQIIYANRGLLEIFQCRSMREFREMTGNSFRGIVYHEDLEEVEQSIRAQISASHLDLDYVEYRIQRADGALRWIEDYGHFVRNENAGNFFYVFMVDATEKRDRMQTERAILLSESREKEQRIQSLIESYDKERALINQEYLRRLEVIEGLSINYESILYADLAADQVMPYRLSSRTQPMFEELFRIRSYSGYYADYVAKWVCPEDRQTVEEMTSPPYIRAHLAQAPSYYLNYRVLIGGEEQYLQLRLVNVGRQGGCTQVVLGYRRVDEEIQKEMEQRRTLAQALSDANAAMTVKNTFLSNMSHDMRTPLNAILGFIALARRSIDDPGSALGYLDRAEASARQLLDLIDKVLELAQERSEQAHVPDSLCSLCDISREVYAYLQPQAEEKRIDFSLDLSALRCPEVYSDPEKLRRMLLYLVNNALTYTNPGGRVGVQIEQGAGLPNNVDEYRIVVWDTGIGISREFLDRIFDPFARERNTTLSGVHGVGLGLTIVRNLVDHMGGTIEVESELGAGSRFTVTLRLRRQVQTEPGEKSARPAERVGGGSILLVEDNEINLEIEMILLEEAGFRVDTAEDGRAALEKIKAAAPGQYDLILMDIQMPVMDGWQAARAIRKLENPALAGIPIIALSANALDSDARRSLESGMNAHMNKPLDMPALLDKIDEVLHAGG